MPTMHPYSCASFLPEAKASDGAAVLSTPRVVAPAAPATAMISDAFPRIRVGLSFSKETMVCTPKAELEGVVPCLHNLKKSLFVEDH